MSKSDSEQYSVPGFKKDSKLIAKPRRECLMDVDLAYDFSRIRLDEEDVNSELSEAELPADDDPTSPQMEKKFTPDACLFVASLVSSRTEKQLQESVTDHFERWGALDNVKVLKDSMNRPYSFVQFRDVESAERALREAHNTLVDGRHIRVEKARVNRKLYITRISTGLKEEELQEALWIHGPLDSFRMMRNAATGDAKGSCFVQYRFREDAIKAFMSIKNLGRWEVEWASTQEKIPRSYDFNSIFVGQLSPSQITRDSLDARFKTYGVIDSLSLINKPTADNAFAFIKYSSQDACVRAIEGEDGIFWHDRPMRVQFKEAGPKPRSAPQITTAPALLPLSYLCLPASYASRWHQG
ncbi:hypothetical protein DSO57_1012543 [Entomophthora muscae]|uniref:Uncharacterized protein n=1 Tax=Entomophthora muscae TaxID=34485 RepID=A0ACC2SUS0_9FUNG|nr:hypothetical protein DSO57_1012543 [Entomophthora muscae]